MSPLRKRVLRKRPCLEDNRRKVTQKKIRARKEGTALGGVHLFEGFRSLFLDRLTNGTIAKIDLISEYDG